jgi:hypothetical protein
MEEPPYIFQGITDFSVDDVEKVDARVDCIRKLTLEIGSKIPAGRYSVVLSEPFPPFGRAGNRLKKLRSLRAMDIESIWAFPRPDDGKRARLEITATNGDRTIFRCRRIAVLPLRHEATC